MDHRGRFQAQGKDLEASRGWAQMLPLTAVDGLQLLNDLEKSIPAKEAKIRARGFAQCRKFVTDAQKNGGIQVAAIGKVLMKSFPKGFKERVDVEVHAGTAFV
ncbi:hypothetical protein FHW88_005211 [Mucilaginibacter sp. SG538B]|uniref:hypothetical protein n=1 Tax=Mucilaginibacter sp. SG538B TaxID=2587021 RepID=UPI00159D3A3C|nr:hypothetical protein [Mucilaginibacter sp. SG538B]NVM66893.1 hypothetical protein [Mucilaginibacter sp. SG538B]